MKTEREKFPLSRKNLKSNLKEKIIMKRRGEG